MPITLSPLRYPGGKTKIYSHIRFVLEENKLLGGTYAEPFAGGAGVALKLLLKGDVQAILINDYDPAIYAFWKSAIYKSDEFCELIRSTPVTIEEWHKQRKIFSSLPKDNELELGFSTFFLNRTNVSGILTGGVIGGIEQEGNYTLSARYNKENLVKKIKRIAERKDSIYISRLDAVEIISSSYYSRFNNIFLYIDPPYVTKGSRLYKNSYIEKDHILLAKTIQHCSYPWVVTYDKHPLISELYKNCFCEDILLRYSIGKHQEYHEYIIYSPGLIKS